MIELDVKELSIDALLFLHEISEETHNQKNIDAIEEEIFRRQNSAKK